jgi:hypothetical protein
MREFMDEDELETGENLPSDLPDVCRCLRTKTAFGASIGYRPWQYGASSTAVYWCLHTMASAGPDENLVHPHNCKHGRSCFKSADDV